MSGAGVFRQGAAINHSKQKRITSLNFDPSEKLSNASSSRVGGREKCISPLQKKNKEVVTTP